MNSKESKRKEELLSEIEKLISYGENDSQTIDPSLLDYLDEEALLGIKKNLLEKVGKLSDEDKAWLQQFKKYE